MMRTYQDEQQDPCCFPKRVIRARNLRVRTLDVMAKDRPLRPRPLTLRFLSGPVHARSTKKALPGALAVLSCRAYSLVGTYTVAPFPCLHNVL